MADQPTPLGDPHEDGTLTPEEQAAQAEVVALLGSLDALKPDSPEPGTPLPDAVPMPEEVWARLQAALSAQAAARSAVPESSPAGRRRNRWASGLVAASVAVVAVGVGATVLRQGSTSSETVTAATAAEAAAPVAASAEAFAAQAAPADAAAADAAKAEQDASLADGSSAVDPDSGGPNPGDPAAGQSPPTVDLRVAGDPPARVVLASSTDYTPEDLPGQLSSLFASMGVDSASEAMAMQVRPVTMPVADGFTASWQALRDCVTWLTESPDEQALLVDRARFLGTDAGVVVAPGDDGPALGEQAESAASASPSPTFTVNALVGSLDVWVVDPACTKSVGSIREYLDYRWQE